MTGGTNAEQQETQTYYSLSEDSPRLSDQAGNAQELDSVSSEGQTEQHFLPQSSVYHDKTKFNIY